jgi:hypothetical protein
VPKIKSIKPKLKALYIAVRPVGSKFARALQSTIKERVQNNVWRVSHTVGDRHERKGRSLFRITSEPMNKIQQMKAFKENNVSHPPFTTDPAQVGELGSKVVFARTLINSTNGRGIVEFELQDGVPPPRAPLYTAYIPKKAEYRAHVFNGRVVDLQQKRKKRDFENERDTRVRNLKNGYVYTRGDINPPAGINELAVAAVAAVGYRYGAVDVVFNEKKNKLYVLEVNSRPGLMGTTLERYSEALINQFNLRMK